MRIIIICAFLTIFLACKSKVEKIKPRLSSISESIYASGSIKSKNQYQIYVTVSGIVDTVLVAEGDTVKKGSILLKVSSETQRLSKENAALTERFSDDKNNEGKLSEAKLVVDLAKIKLRNDSTLYQRQKVLWEKQVGTKVELELRELAYTSSATALFSAKVKYTDLKRQLDLNSAQTKNNFKISDKVERDFSLKSEIDGIVYSLSKLKGDFVGPQIPIGVIGDAEKFILEMQVDEYDIMKIKRNQLVLVTLDSYKGKVFEASVTNIKPLMSERSKTFLVEAEFNKVPNKLYPNVNFEANIVVQTNAKALLIPRNYLLNDSTVIKSNGDTVVVKTGLKDYINVEIYAGLSAEDEILKPGK